MLRMVLKTLLRGQTRSWQALLCIIPPGKVLQTGSHVLYVGFGFQGFIGPPGIAGSAGQEGERVSITLIYAACAPN